MRAHLSSALSAFIHGFTSSGRERRAATAGAGGVGVLEDEPAAHDLVLEVDLDAAEVDQAFVVAQDLHAVRLELLVGLALLFLDEVQRVGEPAAPAALHADAQLGLLGRERAFLALVVDDLANLLGGRFGQHDGHGRLLVVQAGVATGVDGSLSCLPTRSHGTSMRRPGLTRSVTFTSCSTRTSLY